MDLKRCFDIAVSAGALTAFSPIIGGACLISRWKIGSPVFFVQERPGLHKKPFNMLKMRTMKEAYDEHGEPLPDEERMTAWGDFLRKTSLDELPTLINVLKGEMSLVGPRPLLSEYLSLYNEEQLRRFEAKPGVTGWAQVNGRNTISWEQRFEYDVWYVENQSFWVDFKILLKTLDKVLRRSDINKPGHATMTKFTGTKPDSATS